LISAFHVVTGMVHHAVVNRAVDWRKADLDALAAELAPAHPGDVFGVVVQDSAGSILAATPAAEDILGVTFEQMSDRTSMDSRWVTVDERLRRLDGHQHPAMRALASGQPVRDVVMGLHRPNADLAGKHVWLSVTAVPIGSIVDDAPMVLTVFSVLNGPRATELRLMESEAGFRFIAENSSDMVAWQRFDTTFLWVSPASAALLGRSPEQLIGTRSIDLVHPDDVPKVEAAQRQVAAGTVHTTVVRRMRHADGHYVWVETTARIVAGESLSAAEMQTSSRNVDDRIAAQRAQADAEASRDSAVRLFRTAMEHAAIGMAIRDLDGLILEVNGALCTMLGRAAEDLKGSFFRDFTHPDDIGAAGAARTVLLSGRAVSHDSERRYLRPDGEVLWVQATSVLLPKDDGEPQLVLTQMQDITARKDAIDQLTLLAVTDSLTGLPNRAVLMDRLADALAAAQRGHGDAGVVFVDLDGFKAVNDNLGHDVGDELLRQVAGRLSAAIRTGDTAARIGGDEFVVLCERIGDLEGVREVADRICRYLSGCFLVAGHNLWISASVGVTLGNGLSPREVLGRADEAMYRAKRQGRGLIDVCP
jgi:diguanylate cyclase (GGDEF)-like protein/PAS domain S-box-containing protein